MECALEVQRPNRPRSLSVENGKREMDASAGVFRRPLGGRAFLRLAAPVVGDLLR